MNYIDYKITIWKRLHFSDDANMNNIVDTLKETNDLDNVIDDDLGFKESEILYDTENEIAVEDNDYNTTVEVYSNHSLIWENK